MNFCLPYNTQKMHERKKKRIYVFSIGIEIVFILIIYIESLTTNKICFSLINFCGQQLLYHKESLLVNLGVEPVTSSLDLAQFQTSFISVEKGLLTSVRLQRPTSTGAIF
jgi:hypothetical protein